MSHFFEIKCRLESVYKETNNSCYLPTTQKAEFSDQRLLPAQSYNSYPVVTKTGTSLAKGHEAAENFGVVPRVSPVPAA